VQDARGKKRKDCSLTFLALALFGYMLSTGVAQLKYLYSEHVYGWGAVQLSYYMTWINGLRAVNLLFILPYVIATFKPKKETKLTMPNSEALSKPKPTRADVMREIRFDLLLTRLSFVLDILSYTFVILFPSPYAAVHALPKDSGSYSQFMFVAASSLNSFGSGVVPAMQSLALCILKSHSLANSTAGGNDGDVGIGRLLGALAVLQAIGQLILAPVLFGFIYSATVANCPKAIFAIAAGIGLVSLAFVLMIQPYTGRNGKRRRARAEVEIERGRSRVSKDLRRYTASSEASGSGSSR